jgi:hypothetical protein
MFKFEFACLLEVRYDPLQPIFHRAPCASFSVVNKQKRSERKMSKEEKKADQTKEKAAEAPEKKTDLGILEEDDEFEEFPADGELDEPSPKLRMSVYGRY